MIVMIVTRIDRMIASDFKRHTETLSPSEAVAQSGTKGAWVDVCSKALVATMWAT